MAKRCIVTGKGVLTGYNVSHANNKSKRRFLPNLQVISVWSEALEQTVRLKLSVDGLRTLEHKGGFDAYLHNTSNTQLPPKIRFLKQKILRLQKNSNASGLL